MPFIICLDDLTRKDVQSLVSEHISGMHSTTPVEYAYAVNVEGLKHQDIKFWTAWDGDILLGCGGLRIINQKHGEIKSMRTHHDHLRKGVAAQILEHIIHNAKQRGFSILSLETGTGPEFDAAVNLYKKYGFQKGEAFANYDESPYNQFFHLSL